MTRGVNQQLLKRKLQSQFTAHSSMSSIITIKDDASSNCRRSLKALALIGAGLSTFLSFAKTASVDEAEHGLECPSSISMASQGHP